MSEREYVSVEKKGEDEKKSVHREVKRTNRKHKIKRKKKKNAEAILEETSGLYYVGSLGVFLISLLGSKLYLYIRVPGSLAFYRATDNKK